MRLQHSHRRQTHTQLAVEALEDRTLPVVGLITMPILPSNWYTNASFNQSTGEIAIQGSIFDDNVQVLQTGASGGERVSVTDGGVEILNVARWSNYSLFGYVYQLPNVKSITFRGAEGADRYENRTNITSTAWGGPGNDVLIGGIDTDTLHGEGENDTLRGDYDVGYYSFTGATGGNDKLYGGPGNDILEGRGGDDLLKGESGYDSLYGNDGNDRLYGGSEWDYLNGGNNDDFLDAGESWEYVEGGLGNDYNAFVPVVNGIDIKDVRQGADPTCMEVAKLASAARTGTVNLASGITYLGDSWYRVRVFRITSAGSVYETSQQVYFDGTRSAGEVQSRPDEEGEFWTLLYYRAVFQEYTATSNAGGGAELAKEGNTFVTLTGRKGQFYGEEDDLLFWRIFWATQLKNANVMTGTPDFGKKLVPPVHPYLVNGHAYTVVGAWSDSSGQKWVQVRNPWGYDGGVFTYGNADDGLINLTWEEYKKAFDATWIA